MYTMPYSVEIASTEIDIEIGYEFSAGSPPTQMDPGSDASIEIIECTILHSGKKYDAPWLVDILCDDEDLARKCLEDADERAQDEEEYRAECRREYRIFDDCD